MTRARRRRPVDVERVAAAVSGPGVDTRTWLSAARVEPGPSRRWESEHGWIVDVEFYGSELDQLNQVPCRVISSGPAGDGFGEYLPPAVECEVSVGLHGGNPGADPVVLGHLTNSSTCRPPTVINGQTIVADLKTSQGLDGDVSPFDTELKRSPHSRREQYAGHLVQQARQIRLQGDELTQIIVESGARLEIIGRGTAILEMRHEGTGAILVDGADIRLADGAREIARVGDFVAGSAAALTPNPDGSLPVAGRIVSGQPRAKA